MLHIKPIAEQDRSTQGLISTTTLKDLIGWGAKINSNPIKPQELFKSTAYKNMPLEFYCEINPKTIYPDDIEDVSFIPMECVSDIYGEIIEHKNGKSTNSKGYKLHIKATNIREQAKKEFEEAVFGEAQKVTN